MGLLGNLLGPSRQAMAATIDAQRQALVKIVRARFDAASDTPLNKRHWAGADHYSADAALSPWVRRKMRARARHEAQNNGYLAGMVNTLATDAIGTGPQLLLDCGPTPTRTSWRALRKTSSSGTRKSTRPRSSAPCGS